MNHDPQRRANEEEIQPLPLHKIVRIAVRGIKVRIWRSVLVVSGIVLAMAFLSYILCSDAFARNVMDYGSRDLIRHLIAEGILNPETLADQRVQTYWVAGLALLISLAGIMNAMLMSVTERFREIGTMKCLGALTSFIMKLFLIESLFAGVLGTTLGLIIGFGLAYVEGYFTYGAEVTALFPPAHLLLSILFCFITGILLTLLGAIYPARLAAKMSPVMALRSEM
ncbi:MAG: ABC transporter permease [Verrucomicrobia bacterium]|nr:ABC transporter permease [Verrucomicrobiota bacterium]MCH8527680.1 FtsX-like permease family protein [Kiritimatiellia bacterium]